MSDRSALISAVVTYNLRLWLAGLSAAVLVPLSGVALILDLLTGQTEDGLARKVLAASARMEAVIDVHGDLTDVRVIEDDAVVYDEPAYEPA